MSVVKKDNDFLIVARNYSIRIFQKMWRQQLWLSHSLKCIIRKKTISPLPFITWSHHQEDVCASAYCCRTKQHVCGSRTWMFFASFKDVRGGSCLSDSLSFVNKSNLRHVLFLRSSKIPDNHAGPHRVWRNHRAGIHVGAICVMEGAVWLWIKCLHEQNNIYTPTHRHACARWLIRA